ncbi:Pex2 / Pex12 amino terminal domain-containing protein, putative [Eimeria acervulina]|uniref:RING-type E3 ubiquitin transferase (cysteine targeting) n=1 Tax=Eimeria acervulina TaxID=5801 RepID=U6GKH8_EIMAC|nr:Pex2 / Pex12 amino terminal domain-containing protein, putative [Eimeria acervulina]CDI79099.1 Pex2 / Pex12 amino terminal domain-containing protein, putative [Eimeria acervulina]
MPSDSIGGPLISGSIPSEAPNQEGPPTAGGPPRGPLGAPLGAPLPRMVVRPPCRGELLLPYGRSRQPKEYLFLKSVIKPKQTAADINRGALAALHTHSVGAPNAGPPDDAYRGPHQRIEPSDETKGHGEPTGARGIGSGSAAAAAAAAAVAAPSSSRHTPAATAPTTAAPAAAAGGRRMTLSETAAAVGHGLPLRSSAAQQQQQQQQQQGMHSLPTQRVNQLDALRVNNEIVLLLQDMLLQCTRTAAPWLQQRQQELQLLLHLFLWGVSTARDKPTPGDLLQNVKYYGGEQLQQQQLEQQQQRLQQLQQDPTAAPAAVQQQQRVLLHLMLKQQHSLLQQQPLPWKHKLGLLVLHVLLPYAYQLLRQQLHRKRQQQQAAIEQRIRRYNVAQALRRQRMQQQQQKQQQQQLREHATEQEKGELKQQEQQQQQQQQQQLQQQQQQLRLLESATGESVTRLTAAELWLECKYRSVGEWLLGLQMRHIHPSLRRSLSFELMQQQLYWLSVSQVLLLLLPHIDLLLLRRMLRLRLLSPARRAAAKSLQQLKLLLLRQQQQQQHQLQQRDAESEEKGLAAAAAVLPLGIGQRGVLLLRSTKQHAKKLLQDVGLLPHPLVIEEQQQQKQQQQQQQQQQQGVEPPEVELELELLPPLPAGAAERLQLD